MRMITVLRDKDNKVIMQFIGEFPIYITTISGAQSNIQKEYVINAYKEGKLCLSKKEKRVRQLSDGTS